MSLDERMLADFPAPHAALLRSALARLSADDRVVGVAAGGSFVTGSMDEYSDLDLVVVIERAAYDALMEERLAIAGRLGPLLAGFTGEHVGEPRLLICLYGPPVLHVDLKFVRPEDLAVRVEEPVVLWERDGRVSQALAAGEARYPMPDPQWIEDRFWVWVHYVAGKIGRGELLEACDGLGLLRAKVLGPLGLMERGERPAGVRKIERVAPELAEELRPTIAAHDAGSCLAALDATIALYRALRECSAAGDLVVRREAERAVVEYVEEEKRAWRARRGSPSELEHAAGSKKDER